MVNRLTMLAVLILFIVSGCGFLDDRVPCDEWTFTEMMLTPPPDAVVLSEECRMGIQPMYSVTFTMPDEQLTTFQESTLVTQWHANAAREQSRFAEITRDAASYIVGRYTDGAYLVDTVIDTSHTDIYTVYYAISFID